MTTYNPDTDDNVTYVDHSLMDEHYHNPYQSADYDKVASPSKPTPLTIHITEGLPKIKADDMPELLARRIHDISYRMQSSPEFSYTGLMTSISTAIGTKMGVYPKQYDDGFFVSPTIWAMIVGETGTMKSESQSQSVITLKKLDAKLSATFKTDLSSYKKKMKKLQTELTRLEKIDGSIEEIHELNNKLQDLVDNPPQRQTIIINDATKEALQKEIASSTNGVLYEVDELMGFFRYVEKMGNDSYREFLLELWNGKYSSNSFRVGNGKTEIPRSFLSILGGIQPEKLKIFIRDCKIKYGNDGLTPRFQMVFLPVVDNFQYVDMKEDAAIEQEINDVIEFLYSWNPKDDPNYEQYRNKDNILGLSFDYEAQQVFVEWYTEMMNRVRGKAIKKQELRDHLNKYPALMAKIALDYHAIEHAPTGQIPAFISKLNVIRAIAMCEILECHAKQMYEGFSQGGTQETNLALDLLEQVKVGSFKDGMTLSKMKRANLGEEEELKEALELLIEHGWMESQTITGSNRPSTQYKMATHARSYLKNESDYIIKVTASHEDMVWSKKLDEYREELRIEKVNAANKKPDMTEQLAAYESMSDEEKVNTSKLDIYFPTRSAEELDALEHEQD